MARSRAAQSIEVWRRVQSDGGEVEVCQGVDPGRGGGAGHPPIHAVLWRFMCAMGSLVWLVDLQNETLSIYLDPAQGYKSS
jgi:hypothetical protein